MSQQLMNALLELIEKASSAEVMAFGDYEWLLYQLHEEFEQEFDKAPLEN